MGTFADMTRIISVGEACWRAEAEHGLLKLCTTNGHSGQLVQDGHAFINMVSCSYLGLNRHPMILRGAREAIEREGVLNHSVSRTRVAPALLGDAESAMSQLFDCEAYLTPSCFVATATVLPLYASGHLSAGKKPLMVFDRRCHFSMMVMKAFCADQAEVVTIEHNDMTALEALCRRHAAVVYICEAAYAAGGVAQLEELLRLQEKYGLYLYVDDSHSISAYGSDGQGFMRSAVDTLGDRIIISGSLAKSFGAIGGVILCGSRRVRELFEFNSPAVWTQQFSVPGIGAALATAHLHMTDEVIELRERLETNIAYFDSRFPSAHAGNRLPVRFIELGESQVTLEASRRLLERGFYVAAVCPPIVPAGQAGLRLMLRADLSRRQLQQLCEAMDEVANPALAHTGS